MRITIGQYVFMEILGELFWNMKEMHVQKLQLK